MCIVVYTCSSSTYKLRREDHREFKISLVDIVSSNQGYG